MPAVKRKKTDVPKKEWMALSKKHKISFEGPVKASCWPGNHAHTFRVIREISKVRHDEYTTSERLPEEKVSQRLRTADDIAAAARQLRNGSATEASWQGQDGSIMAVFARSAVCDRCKNELHVVEHEARRSPGQAAAQLEEERQRRKLCTAICHQQGDSGIAISGHDDNIHPMPFVAVANTSLTHHPQDELEHTNIPMKPDLVVGLSEPEQWLRVLESSSSGLTHFPMPSAPGILYPFLLTEAKRAVTTPGFTAVEAQTAFAIRRLVLLQDSLYKAAGTNFDPLVWFFAYQGEERRLYAGTLDRDNVHVYDLWHGTVESADGALQVLQIVDYLWSWARDVYRPQVRESLRAVIPALEETASPTNANLDHPETVLLDSGSTPPTTTSRPDIVDTGTVSTAEASMTQPEASVDQNTNFGLLQYGAKRPNQELHSFSDAELRHSDTIHFSFRVFNFPTYADLLQNPGSEAEYRAAMDMSESFLRSETVVVLSQRQINDIGKFWLGDQTTWTSTPPPRTELGKQKLVCFQFRTFLKGADWQIKRRLDCIVWDIEDLKQRNEVEHQTILMAAKRRTNSVDIEVALLELMFMVRDMTGKHSVACASLNTTLTLGSIQVPVHGENPLQWKRAFGSRMEDITKVLLSSPYVSPPFRCANNEIASLESRVPPGPEISKFMSFPQDFGWGDSVLMKRPQIPLTDYPGLCLFVTGDIGANDRHGLQRLLSSIVRDKPIKAFCVSRESGIHSVELDSEEKAILRRWLRAYEG